LDDAAHRLTIPKGTLANWVAAAKRGTSLKVAPGSRSIPELEAEVTMSRRGNCCDNTPMESFWGSLKNELIHHQRYATRADAQAAIQEYIGSFYNRERRHSRPAYISPAAFAEEFSRQQQAA
jgi:transposase InsO family protein